MKLNRRKASNLFLMALASVSTARFVADVNKCPSLSPRSPPDNVHDLRPDDIKVIGALGDRWFPNSRVHSKPLTNLSSIMAGFSVKDINISLPIAITSKNIREYRGLSYTMGGDKGAPTLPNYIKYYQPNLTGYSTGEHLPEYCFCEWSLPLHFHI